MTNSEAIAVLMEHKRYVHENSVPDQALDMGIKALKNERKKGKWIVPHHDVVISGTCSCCGWDAILFETDVAGMPYCPNCGADMREEKTDDKK